MKVVILDGNGPNPGDLSYSSFEGLGELTIYDTTPSHLAAERIGGAEIVLVNKVLIGKDVIDACPNIRYIGLFSTGFNNIDVEYAQSRGITVTNVPHYSTDAVAQHVFALVLHFYSQVVGHHERVKQGEWIGADNFCFYSLTLQELAGKTMGIIGYGAIGRRVAELAEAFHMHTLVHTRTPRPKEESKNRRFTGLDSLLQESDIVTLHCPLTEETHHLMDKNRLEQMKSTALLINTSRGPLVNEADLAAALNEGRIAGAGVDVVEQEPMQAGCTLLHAKNCVITPHMAWGAKETRQRLLDIVYDNAARFLEGKPVNCVPLTSF